jgi:hypothetical protein
LGCAERLRRIRDVERCANSETGTGSACALLSEIRSSRRLRSRRQDDKNCAKLSEILSAARVARSVRMIHGLAMLATSG